MSKQWSCADASRHRAQKLSGKFSIGARARADTRKKKQLTPKVPRAAETNSNKGDDETGEALRFELRKPHRQEEAWTPKRSVTRGSSARRNRQATLAAPFAYDRVASPRTCIPASSRRCENVAQSRETSSDELGAAPGSGEEGPATGTVEIGGVSRARSAARNISSKSPKEPEAETVSDGTGRGPVAALDMRKARTSKTR